MAIPKKLSYITVAEYLEGGWLTFFYTQPEDEVEFASVNFRTNVAEIYRGISFSQ